MMRCYENVPLIFTWWLFCTCCDETCVCGSRCLNFWYFCTSLFTLMWCLVEKHVFCTFLNKEIFFLTDDQSLLWISIALQANLTAWINWRLLVASRLHGEVKWFWWLDKSCDIVSISQLLKMVTVKSIDLLGEWMLFLSALKQQKSECCIWFSLRFLVSCGIWLLVFD